MVLAFNIVVGVLTTLFVLVCLFMILVVLIQKPKGGGLSGAFGGAGSAQSVMGAKTGEFLTWFTVGCFVAFLLLAMGLTWAINAEPHTAEAIAARAAEEAKAAESEAADSSPEVMPEVPAESESESAPPVTPAPASEPATTPEPATEPASPHDSPAAPDTPDTSAAPNSASPTPTP